MTDRAASAATTSTVAAARTPRSTYRLQITGSFDLDEATRLVPYLARLGVDTVYLSPILQASRGSEHGYDVVDPTRVDDARGGPEALARLAVAAHEAGLGVLVDIVPNHQGVGDPMQNPWWAAVLREGRTSPHASAFDIDWEVGDGRVWLPVLGSAVDDVVARGELRVSPEGVGEEAPFGHARYFDLVLPLAAGTAPAAPTSDPDTVLRVLDQQHWRLASWRDEAAVLNYRRFFTITSLAGVRVEDADVFAASHAEVLRWFREGLVDGLRIDHPDGLADPGRYLDDLAAAVSAATGAAPFVAVEKILEYGETLPSWWATDGTTGYDAMAEIDRVLIDAGGEAGLTALDDRLRAATGLPPASPWPEMIAETKRVVAETSQAAEVARLVRCAPTRLRDAVSDEELRSGLVALLAAFPVYRSYLPAGGEHVRHAADEAVSRHPEHAAAIAAIAAALLDPGLEFSRRFMQTTGPVMAKGVEDAAFYRYTRLGTLTEVGGDPSQFALGVDEFHDAAQRRQSAWPTAMTALTTHDTKRSEDVRARLSVLAEIPERWSDVLGRLREIASTGHGPFDNLVWQAIVGAWPASEERLRAYAVKAARESAERTSWADPDDAFEARIDALVAAAHGQAAPVVDEVVAAIQAAGRSNALAAKLLQLAGPGVPDVYQGTELWDLSLVDPDNRRPVDYAVRAGVLDDLDRGELPPIDDSGAAKALVVSRALRLRRDRADLFHRYAPLPAVGAAASHVIAFDRGGAIAAVTRLPMGLTARGGWGDTVVMLPSGRWTDALTGAEHDGGAVPAGELFARYPVTLLTRE
ncbi:malto-oligosyltrehalose synthase [Microbacterium sp. TNHR37B]|uniref:malto-oligosyltrehalose synthase n=1 Tax=Microbacterium sp. TNHR37B TaxID=1775956 RepID=UPI0007B1A2C4|nr:malto-oligosyltrehalose synthase [Microbacterium sp. TNHR37B]KZE89382.1 Maltooligosyl trehalose synthase [Microbacterium sp. TNHR37B]